MEKKIINYSSVRDNIQNGDIILYKGRDVAAAVIRLFTHSDYSHAGLAVKWNERLMVMEAVARGILISPLSKNIERYSGDVEWYTCTETISEDRREKLINFAQKFLGEKYGWRSVILLGIKIFLGVSLNEKDRKDSEGRLFCSQYVSKCYNAIGIDLDINKGDGTTSPDDLEKSPKTVIKGILKLEGGEKI